MNGRAPTPIYMLSGCRGPAATLCPLLPLLVPCHNLSVNRMWWKWGAHLVHTLSQMRNPVDEGWRGQMMRRGCEDERWHVATAVKVRAPSTFVPYPHLGATMCRVTQAQMCYPLGCAWGHSGTVHHPLPALRHPPSLTQARGAPGQCTPLPL